MVQQLDEVERLEALVTESESSSERESVIVSRGTEVQEREAEIAERVSELQAERDEAAADIPQEVLDLYNTLCEQHDGEATAHVEIEFSAQKSFLAAAAACRFRLPLCQNCTQALDKFSSAPTAPASCFSEKMSEMSWTKTPKRMSSVVRKQLEKRKLRQRTEPRRLEQI